jgi:hypothetical protein
LRVASSTEIPQVNQALDPRHAMIGLFIDDPWNYLFTRIGKISTRKKAQAQWESLRQWQLDFTSLHEFELRLSFRCVCQQAGVSVRMTEQSLTEMKARKMAVKMQVRPFPYHRDQECACASRTKLMVEDILR